MKTAFSWHGPSDHPHLPDSFQSPPLLMEIQYPGESASFRTGYAVKCGEDGEDSVIYLTDDDVCVQGYAMKRWAYVSEMAANSPRYVESELCEIKAAWTEDPDGTWTCSHCGLVWVLAEGSPADNEMNYCPKCGARIEEGGEMKGGYAPEPKQGAARMARWHKPEEEPEEWDYGYSRDLLIEVGKVFYCVGYKDLKDNVWMNPSIGAAAAQLGPYKITRWAYLDEILEEISDDG